MNRFKTYIIYEYTSTNFKPCLIYGTYYPTYANYHLVISVCIFMN